MKSWFRPKISLEGFWKFKIDKDLIGDKEEWFKGFESNDLIFVPSSWNEQNPEWDQFTGVAWYQKDFYIQKELEGKLAWIRFEGAGYKTRIWTNGNFVGEHEGAFTSFGYAIKELKFGGFNRIVVRIDNSPSIRNLPPALGLNVSAFDFFHYGGIHRPVYLEFTDKCYVEDLTIYTSSDGSLKALIDNVCEEPVSLKVSLASKDLNSIIYEETVSDVKSGRYIYKKKFSGIKPWSPEEPNLYNLIVELYLDGELKDSVYERIGFRSIKVKEGKIYVNDKPVFLKGFGRHEDYPVFGKNLPGPVLIRDFYLMKKMGANSFRTSHYPYSNMHLDMADEFGFLVILEPPLCYSGMERIADKKSIMKLFSDREYLAKAKKVIAEMIKEHKNRPSVIMYSVMNEPQSDMPEIAEVIKELSAYFNKLDPSRPTTFASNRSVKDLALGYVDVISLNFYRGWYSEWGDIDRGVESLMADLEAIHRRHPDKPIIITEFGASAVLGLHSDPPQMWSEEYQAEFIRKYVEALSRKDYIVGLHVWNFADFRTPQTPWRTILNRKGVFTRDRQPKLSVAVLSSSFNKLEKRWRR
ncbi:glycoside hydrolase family 2 protein [Candidatus Bathyarchaeota archaeon]|nr:glycoside hydrolase family 2 protein [Candidatus Bathyarchaeota archaeon]